MQPVSAVDELSYRYELTTRAKLWAVTHEKIVKRTSPGQHGRERGTGWFFKTKNLKSSLSLLISSKLSGHRSPTPDPTSHQDPGSNPRGTHSGERLDHGRLSHEVAGALGI